MEFAMISSGSRVPPIGATIFVASPLVLVAYLSPLRRCAPPFVRILCLPTASKPRTGLRHCQTDRRRLVEPATGVLLGEPKKMVLSGRRPTAVNPSRVILHILLLSRYIPVSRLACETANTRNVCAMAEANHRS